MVALVVLVAADIAFFNRGRPTTFLPRSEQLQTARGDDAL